jgi:Fe-S cluster biosynthesis and repair protein YggX
MPDNTNRIEQFRKMAEADPNNELGHFSLGRELLQAERFDEAAGSFERCLAINPNISKAYQFLATALLNLGRQPEAIAKLTEGATRADERGDMMPRNDMARMLKELGAPVPPFKQAAAERAAGEGDVQCVRCGRVNKRLTKPPFRNELGQEIYEKVCADCFREWIGMGTKVINELRLPLADPQAQKIYDQHMIEFLNLRA